MALVNDEDFQVAAISALILGGFVGSYFLFEDFAQVVDSVMSSLWGALAYVWNKRQEILDWVWTTLWGSVTAIWSWVWGLPEWVWTSILGGLLIIAVILLIPWQDINWVKVFWWIATAGL